MKLLQQYAESIKFNTLKEVIEANIIRSIKESQKARTQAMINKIGG